MKSKLSTLMIAAGVAGGLSLAAPGVANAEPAGQYTYTCVSTDGSSYLLNPGDELTTCKGSYLQKHINGVQVESVPLTGQGTVADPNALNMDCIMAVTGVTVTVMTTSGWALVASTAIGAYGLKACVA